MRMKFGKRKTDFECCRRKLASVAGMSLTEMLAALLILSMTALVIGGGVVAVKHAYQKTTEKAEAQQVLATTVELLTDEFSSALEQEDGADVPRFLSGKAGGWMRFVSDGQRGICRVYTDGGDAHSGVPLLSSGAMADMFYTDFESCTYADACFTVKNLAVYYKKDAQNQNRVPAAILPELKVRAVNLEGL